LFRQPFLQETAVSGMVNNIKHYHVVSLHRVHVFENISLLVGQNHCIGSRSQEFSAYCLCICYTTDQRQLGRTSQRSHTKNTPVSLCRNCDIPTLGSDAVRTACRKSGQGASAATSTRKSQPWWNSAQDRMRRPRAAWWSELG
jgi:hypothetical protein